MTVCTATLSSFYPLVDNFNYQTGQKNLQKLFSIELDTVTKKRARPVIKVAVYEPISVLFVTRGFRRKEFPYHFTPYRFERKTGESFKIKRVKMYHNDYRGGAEQFSKRLFKYIELFPFNRFLQKCFVDAVLNLLGLKFHAGILNNSWRSLFSNDLQLK